MRVHPHLFGLLTVVLVSWSQGNNINTAGEKGLARTLTAETHGLGALTIGAAFKTDYDQDYVKSLDGTAANVRNTNTGETVAVGETRLFTGDVYLAYGLFSFWDFGIDLPLYYDRTGFDEDHTEIGNLELTSKLAYPPGQDDLVLTQAYYGKLIAPTGGEGSGYFPRHAYYIEENGEGVRDSYASQRWVISPSMLWSLHLDRLKNPVPLKIHVNFGGAINSSPAILGAIGLEYTPIPSLSLFVEASGESRVFHYENEFSFSAFDDDVFLVTPGLRYTFRNGLHVTLAGDIGIADDDVRSNWVERYRAFSTKGSPIVGAQISIGWTGLRRVLDRDGDGIADGDDKCPRQAEDADGFEDDDGCPDLDNDYDGILDSLDQCPDVPTLSNGCPDIDPDKDGFASDRDKCPNHAEDVDGFEDTDGCPDADNDGDLLVDARDRCPDEAEDMDGFEDDDGCPDLDHDGDGVPDSSDKCPTIKGRPEYQGCAAQEIERGEPILLDVSFPSGKTAVDPRSYPNLDRLVESLRQWPDIILEIHGHTDNVGSNAVNSRISQKRAESVRDYLKARGIAPERLKPIGYGPLRPIADNTAAEGRAKNRRVEILRTD